MKVKSEKIGFSLTVPDKITIRQQMRYKGSTMGVLDKDDKYVILWHAAQPLIETWESALVPDYKTIDLDQLYDPAVANLVMEVGSAVWLHIQRLGEVRKNS